MHQRVTITCDLNTPTGVERRELPFVVLIVADVAGESQPTDKPSRGDGHLHTIDRQCFDDALAAVQPLLTLKDIPGLGAVPLRFNRMADFTPLGIVGQIDALWKRLRQRREVEWQWRRSHAPGEAPCPELAPLDDALSESVSAILHDADFQRLEATWRGIHHMVCGSPPSDAVVFRLMDLNRAELKPALATGVDGSRGVLAQTVLGAVATNAPFGLVVADWAFGHDASSVACLQRMAAIGAEAHVPFIAAADCTAFGLDRQVPYDLEGNDFVDWAEFRQSEDARYVGLAVPRVLMRLPYGDGGEAVDGFDCQERVWPEPAADAAVAEGQGLRQPQLERLLWGNAAFVLAGRLASAFARHGSAVAAWDADDLLEVGPLPRFGYRVADAVEALVGPAEIHWGERRLKLLSDNGFLPLAREGTTGRMSFHGMRACGRPPRRSSLDADPVAQTVAALGGLLVASRVAQALRVMLAQTPGRWATRSEAEAELRAWIARHVMVDDDARPDGAPLRPLRNARLQVLDVPGEPGRLRVAVALRPQLRPGVVEASLRMTVRDSATS